MLDNKIYTFLKLCEVMNYRATAEEMLMTQPAVTQHIHALEDIYGEKLFIYKNKVLSKTAICEKLEEHARSVVYNEDMFRSKLKKHIKQKIRIGATRTVGDYVIDDIVIKLLKDKRVELEIIVDNTKSLLAKLENLELDFLMIEGYFEKNKYDYQLIREEELVGICGLEHPFASKEIPFERVLKEHILLRECGSGTRELFERFLHEKNYSVDSFEEKSIFNSFKLIELSVAENQCISFVYDAITKKNPNMAKFKIRDIKISHEFNFVFLKNTSSRQLMCEYLVDNNTLL